VLALLPNPAARFPLACGPDTATLGIRVPRLGPATAALEQMSWPILQTSANLHGGVEASRVDEVPQAIREEADLVLDAGELPGLPSTVVDLRAYEFEGAWSVLREGALTEAQVAGLIF
jgi:L-threonylcarbamoyladenylate synthase